MTIIIGTKNSMDASLAIPFTNQLSAPGAMLTINK